MRDVSRTFQPESVCVKQATETPPFPGNVYCTAAAGGAYKGRLHTESGQDTFFNTYYFFLPESSAI